MGNLHRCCFLRCLSYTGNCYIQVVVISICLPEMDSHCMHEPFCKGDYLSQLALKADFIVFVATYN